MIISWKVLFLAPGSICFRDEQWIQNKQKVRLHTFFFERVRLHTYEGLCTMVYVGANLLAKYQ
jgi:hypothetical protein